MLYHYARNWAVPEDAEYTLQIPNEPPTFMRHDEVNGQRLAAPGDVGLKGVQISRGSQPVAPPAGSPALLPVADAPAAYPLPGALVPGLPVSMALVESQPRCCHTKLVREC